MTSGCYSYSTEYIVLADVGEWQREAPETTQKMRAAMDSVG